MHNRHASAVAYAGWDVSKDRLDVCLLRPDDVRRRKQFDNTPTGHKRLLRWVCESGVGVRFALEATGNYSLDLALALHAADDVELMVANPRAVKQFAGAQMRRTKTDRADAEAICDFAQRMEFVAWQPPEDAVLELRGIARRMQALTVERTRESARRSKIRRYLAVVGFDRFEIAQSLRPPDDFSHDSKSAPDGAYGTPPLQQTE